MRKSNKHIWKTEWSGHIYFSHGTSNSKGVCTLIRRKLQHSVNQIVTDKDGGFLLMDIIMSQKTYVIGNIYGPTSNSPKEQDTFMDSKML